jgi:hypothetical protein
LVTSLVRMRSGVRLQGRDEGRRRSHWQVDDGRGCQQTEIHAANLWRVRSQSVPEAIVAGPEPRRPRRHCAFPKAKYPYIQQSSTLRAFDAFPELPAKRAELLPQDQGCRLLSFAVREARRGPRVGGYAVTVMVGEDATITTTREAAPMPGCRTSCCSPRCGMCVAARGKGVARAFPERGESAA